MGWPVSRARGGNPVCWGRISPDEGLQDWVSVAGTRTGEQARTRVEIREALDALRRAWWSPVLGLLLGGLIGLVLSLLQASQFTSHTQFFVSTTGAATTSDVFQGSQ